MAIQAAPTPIAYATPPSISPRNFSRRLAFAVLLMLGPTLAYTAFAAAFYAADGGLPLIGRTVYAHWWDFANVDYVLRFTAFGGACWTGWALTAGRPGYIRGGVALVLSAVVSGGSRRLWAVDPCGVYASLHRYTPGCVLW